MSRLLAIMGSGETAPTMVKVHRAVFERTGPGRSVLLDTPYGFQTNRAELTRRTQSYFRQSLSREVEAVSWARDPGPGVDRERALSQLRDASWVFAGPGSPTYALRQWRDTPVPAAVAATVADAGTIVFASAAALTLGAFTVPVYEIYKAGADPHWAPGLDLMAALAGLPAVVIPHYNNAEGGTHDTRYCYLGEQRLALMERELPPDSFVLGVDEHTACLIDLETGSVEVLGTGVLTIRRQGSSQTFPTGATVTLADLAAAASSAPTRADPGTGPDRSGPRAGDAGAPDGQTPDGHSPGGHSPGGCDSSLGGPCSGGGADAVGQPLPLDRAAEGHRAEFRDALAAGDPDPAVAAILTLDQLVEDWSADPSDERDHARSVLRGMVVELGERARAGLADPRRTLAPYVDTLLTLRDQARERRDFTAADLIRDRLVSAGIEVRDTPTGTRWSLAC
jgi:cyanophycinase-like exopeptidase